MLGEGLTEGAECTGFIPVSRGSNQPRIEVDTGKAIRAKKEVKRANLLGC